MSTPATGQPGRYQRSTGGMVGAMIVLLLVVGAFVAFRGLNRNDASRPTPTIPAKQVSAVTNAAREAGLTASVPTPLPSQWRITSISFVPGKRATWHLGILTAEDHYLGIDEQPAPVRELVAKYVDKDAVEGQPVNRDGRTWRTWSDQGGDHGLTTEIGERSYLLSGSGSQTEVLALLDSIEGSLP